MGLATGQFAAQTIRLTSHTQSGLFELYLCSSTDSLNWMCVWAFTVSLRDWLVILLYCKPKLTIPTHPHSVSWRLVLQNVSCNCASALKAEVFNSFLAECNMEWIRLFFNDLDNAYCIIRLHWWGIGDKEYFPCIPCMSLEVTKRVGAGGALQSW